MDKCRCGKTLPVAKFRPFKFCSAYCRSKNWADKNRDKHLKTSENWRKNNPERSNKLKKKWADKNIDLVRRLGLEWRIKNREKNNAKRYIKYREDIEKSRFRKRNYQNRRRSLLKDGTITPAEWDKMKSAANGKCFYCHKKKFLTMDHVIPLSRGGPHCASNIVPACKKCNCSKHAKILNLL